MANPIFTGRTDKFDILKGFKRIRWGARSKPLDIELTEMQKIIQTQMEALGSLVCTDGFLTKPALSYTSGVLTLPADTIVAGGSVFTLTEQMQLAGTAGRTVYLAISEVEVAYSDTIKRNGNLSGGTDVVDNGIYNDEIGMETSRRVQRQLQLVINNSDPSRIYLPVANVTSGGTVTDQRVMTTVKVTRSQMISTLGYTPEDAAMKGTASGYAGLDSLRNVTGNGLRLGAIPYYTNQAFYLSLTATSNQKADIILSGPVHGRIRVTVSGVYAGVDARGSLVKVFSAVLSPPNVVNSAVSRYVEATENLPDHISIGEIGYDSVNSRFSIPVEARTAYINTFSITVELWASVRDATFSLSPVYTGTGATTLPKAIPVIEDNTVLKSGKEFQKYKLTEPDGSGISITSGSVDTLITTGVYTIRNSTVTGLPVASTTGILEVLEYVQRYTETPSLRSWKRRYNAGAWNAWVEDESVSRKNVASGYAGLDASAFVPDARISGNIARISQQVPASTDLNEFRNEGDYFCPSNATAATILNMPTAIAGQAFYLRNNRHAGANQSIVSYNSTTFKIYTRNFYSAATPQWSNWMEIETSASKNVANGYAGLDNNVKVPRVNTYNSLGGASATQITNVDTMLTAGVYPTIQNPTGAPENFFGMLRVTVDSGEAGNGGNWVLQEWMGQAGGNRYVRLKINALAWTTWAKQWDSLNDSSLLVARPQVANNTDYNTITTNGIYPIYQPTGTTNGPGVVYGILTVSKGGSGVTYVQQVVTEVTTGATYTRMINNASTWTPWVTTITSGGGTMEAPLTRKYTGTSYKYTNLASYSLGGSTTGTMKITLPVSWSMAMMRIKISGYEYVAGKGAWELLLGGYNYTTGWAQFTANIVGNAPFTSVRFAYDGSRCCILLGTVGSAWNFPNIEVSEVLAGHVGASGLGGNWSISPITVETGITNVVTPLLSSGNASTLSGWSPSQTAVPNTVVVRDSKGEITGASSTVSKIEDSPLTGPTPVYGASVLSYTPTTDQSLSVSIYLSLMSTSTVAVILSYTDPRLGLKNFEILPSTPLPGDGHTFVPAFIRAKADAEVRLYVAHSDDAFPVYVTASIRKE